LEPSATALDRLSPELEPQRKGQADPSDAAVLNIRRDRWKCKGLRRYLWVLSLICYLFHHFRQPGSKVIGPVLGNSYQGLIVSDDHSAYSRYHKSRLRQLCWAHQIRKFKGLKESRSSPDAICFQKLMLKEAGHMFGCWHAFREGYITRRQLQDATVLVRARMKGIASNTSRAPTLRCAPAPSDAQKLAPPFHVPFPRGGRAHEQSCRVGAPARGSMEEALFRNQSEAESVSPKGFSR